MTTKPDTPTRRFAILDIMFYVNVAITALLIVYFLVAPGFRTMSNLSGAQAWERGEIPKIAWRLHQDLSGRYAQWAERRVASKRAANLNLYDIPSTEWPMFGSVFYLMATESLQEAWETNNEPSRIAPKVYAKDAIDASLTLILDPVHHTWVKEHWGDDYMHEENIFFRMMIMAGIISHEKLLGTGEHLDLLRDQADSMAKALDASPHGVLEDYPTECYPLDIVAAIAMIKRTDDLIGTDHSEFIQRSLRGFTGKMGDERGLVPFRTEARSGFHFQPSRGVGNAFVLIYAHELWPETAKTWYELSESYFWQENHWISGYREYPNDLPGYNWFYDVDAGPILGGYSPAANAFGLAAAILNGRLDHANTLYAQVLPACWPLPDGSLLGPKILSSPTHAPFLGEACMLFMLTRTPAEGQTIVTGGRRPWLLYVGYAFFFGFAGLFGWSLYRRLRRYRAGRDRVQVSGERIQLVIWAVLLVTAGTVLSLGYTRTGTVSLLLALLLPTYRLEKQKKEKAPE